MIEDEARRVADRAWPGRGTPLTALIQAQRDQIGANLLRQRHQRLLWPPTQQPRLDTSAQPFSLAPRLVQRLLRRRRLRLRLVIACSRAGS